MVRLGIIKIAAVDRLRQYGIDRATSRRLVDTVLYKWAEEKTKTSILSPFAGMIAKRVSTEIQEKIKNSLLYTGASTLGGAGAGATAAAIVGMLDEDSSQSEEERKAKAKRRYRDYTLLGTGLGLVSGLGYSAYKFNG